MKYLACALLVAGTALLAACDAPSEHQDLHDFMAETKRRPQGQIEPPPPFRPQQPFAYAAMTLRSPFDRPAADDLEQRGGKTVEPDMTREREYLESFNIAALSMVGTLTKGGVFQVLINDGQGSVHLVTVGNYLGRNHGKIVRADASQIEVLEIIPDGSNGWVERPRIIKLQEKE